jgi:hypothetical protein
MKKLFLLLVLSANTAYSQLVVDEPSKDSVIYSFPLTVLKLVHFYGDINHYAFYYKNTKYEYITDIDYISFDTKEEVLQFFNLLLKVHESGEFTSFTLRNKRFYVAKRGNQIAVYESDDSSEFLITKKIVNKILEELNK